MTGERRALLIGAEEYEGDRPTVGAVAQAKLWNLPAVPNDVAAMDDALRHCGYEIQILAGDDIRYTQNLHSRITDFIASATSGDTLIVYFTGHGLSVSGDACILPAGSTLSSARTVGCHLSTDFSEAVAMSSAGLVIFILDACRDATGEDWGNSKRSVDEARFIRYFSTNTMSPVSYATDDDAAISIFTRTLAAQIKKPNIVNLRQLHQMIDADFDRLNRAGGFDVEIQAPRFDIGEIGRESHLGRPIFSNRGRASTRRESWPYNSDSFDPTAFHCLVVSSEHEAHLAPIRTLGQVVDQALRTSSGREIWEAFRTFWSERIPLNGEARVIEDYDPASILVETIPINTVFADQQNLLVTIRAVVEADLVVFDLTGWEPGIMMLIGIRSATRRGVTICSLGGGWRDGEPIENLPFGLKDLSIHSLGEYQSVRDDDPERLAARAKTGFTQLTSQPSYLDLPAYDSLRQLGSDYRATASIDAGERFVVFCPYDDGLGRHPNLSWPGYERNWSQVKAALRMALNKEGLPGNVERLIDVNTPQMISKAMFEHLRRAEACLFDWTEYNGSVFLELGVRLASSPFGAIQIIDERWTPGMQFAPTATIGNGGGAPISLSHLDGMVQLLNPLFYRVDDPPMMEEVLLHAVNQVVENGRTKVDRPAGMIHELVRDSLSRVAARTRPVHVELMMAADSLHHPDQERLGASQILFSGNEHVKADSEAAALERRIAGWLYLEHRLGAGGLEDESDRRIHRELGVGAATALYARASDGDVELAERIHAAIEDRLVADGNLIEVIESRLSAVALYRARGDALADDDHPMARTDALGTALRLLDDNLTDIGDRTQALLDIVDPESPLTERQRPLVENHVETLGQRGGILKRLGEGDESRASYEKGAELEDRFELSTTYCRLNYVRSSLLAGTATVAELTNYITKSAVDLIEQLETDQTVRDNGWSWADRGDCHALLGEDGQARHAYRQATHRLEKKSRSKVLSGISDVAAALAEHGDPAADRVMVVVHQLAETENSDSS